MVRFVDNVLGIINITCAEGCLDVVSITTKQEYGATVIIASGGYPGNYPKNKEITIKDILKDVLVFHAGTKLENGKLLTSGGRVLAAPATKSTLREAANKVYASVKSIEFKGIYYRNDIAHRAFKYADEQQKETGLSYVAACVDIDADNLLVKKIKPLVKSTHHGIGTKLKIAQTCGIHDTVGIDLVAMNVNDLTVQGAKFRLFLDYYACGKLKVDVTKDFVAGVAEGCLQADPALIGGETAEMPVLDELGDYDGAVFSVGAVERSKILPRADNPIKAGDVLLGLASSGVYLNGFSLVRTIIATQPGLSYQSPSPWKKGTTLGRDLLTPTRIYVKQLLPAIRKGLIKGMAHITGGGFLDNIPKGLGVIFTIGIVLAHLNELAFANFRGLMPGLAYQLGNLISAASSQIQATLGERYPLRNSDGSLQLRDGKPIPDYGLTQAIFMGCVVACLIITTLLGKEERNKDFMQNLYEDKNGQIIGLDDLNAQKKEQGQQDESFAPAISSEDINIQNTTEKK
ncbi:hypothetical protein INT45_009450 [Circinella minor]|uniref:phosphoribosylformylglycinamidine cyclo-ligase n=1 Tax=Circinella minor TaxID=1195481 RepID=A0A8H7S5F5_9FUNG|nr:hypothetical protein INT45_009450 [Circinella minor]